MTDTTADSKLARLNIDRPLYDQSTFIGRLRHFLWMTDWRTVRHSKEEFMAAKELVQQYRLGQEPPGTKDEQVKYAMKLYQSAFHPDSGELQNVFGRMSFQVPGGMAITAVMLQFYRTNTAVIFWQWVNQSFNALVNYTNRNAASSITTTQMAVAYVSATTSAVVASVGLKKFLAKRASSLLQRYVPFVAVAAANMVNLPLTRQSEIMNGIAVYDEDGNYVTESKYAAFKGISQVVFSRILIAAPGMTIMPVIMENLEKRVWFQRMRWAHLPFQTLMIGAFLTFMVPIGCGLFPQRCSIKVEKLKTMDSDKLEELQQKYGDNMPKVLYFNKGL